MTAFFIGLQKRQSIFPYPDGKPELSSCHHNSPGLLLDYFRILPTAAGHLADREIRRRVATSDDAPAVFFDRILPQRQAEAGGILEIKNAITDLGGILEQLGLQRIALRVGE